MHINNTYFVSPVASRTPISLPAAEPGDLDQTFSEAAKSSGQASGSHSKTPTTTQTCSTPVPFVHGRAAEQSALREAFDDFIGQTFYSQLLSAMRKTVSKPAYFHGGRAEEIFQGQLDQMLAERMTEASAEAWTGPMFELFTLARY